MTTISTSAPPAPRPLVRQTILLPPLAHEASILHISEVTLHLLTQARVIQAFLPVEIHIVGFLFQHRGLMFARR